MVTNDTIVKSDTVVKSVANDIISLDTSVTMGNSGISDLVSFSVSSLNYEEVDLFINASVNEGLTDTREI